MVKRGEGVPEPVRIGIKTKIQAMCTVEAKIATSTKITSTVMNALRLTPP